MNASNLSNAWLEAKAAEDAARRKRIEIEEALIADLGVREEGAQTHNLDEHKITITGVLSRSLDAEKWEEIKDQIPADVCPVSYAPKLDITGVKWVEKNRSDIYQILAHALTIKPGKTQVKVVVI